VLCPSYFLLLRAFSITTSIHVLLIKEFLTLLKRVTNYSRTKINSGFNSQLRERERRKKKERKRERERKDSFRDWSIVQW
jgi:hypothetical protein